MASFRDPGIPDGERCVYRGVVDGEEVGRGTQRVEHAGDEGYVQRLEMVIHGEMAYELAMEFSRRRGTLRGEHYRLETAHAGRPVAVDEGWFRDVEGLTWGGELERYPHDIAPLLACAVALRGLEFERGERREFALWLANTVHWPIELRVERRERVSVAAGAHEAWRVRARPSFDRISRALDGLIGAVLPPFVLHFEAEPPHRFLRFEFPTGPFPWNPRGLIEAVELG